MADFDSHLPVRGTSVDLQVGVADSADVRIDPAKEGGNLLSIKTNTDKLDVNLSTRLADATFTARINTLGQKTMANSTPVVLASDQTSIPVTIAGNQAVNLAQVGGVAVALGQTTMSASIPVTIASNQTALDVNNAKVAGTATSVNTGNADAGTQRVVIASNQPAIPVTFTPATLTNSFKYNTAAAVAAGASNTHSYSPASPEKINQIVVAASGQMKVEVQFGTTGAEATIFVGFITTGNPTLVIPFPDMLEIASTQTIKIIRTNRELLSAQDLYSSIFVSA